MKFTYNHLKKLKAFILEAQLAGLVSEWEVGDVRDKNYGFWKINSSPLIFSLPRDDYFFRFRKASIPIEHWWINLYTVWGLNHGSKCNYYPIGFKGTGIKLQDVLEFDKVPQEFKEYLLFHIDILIDI